MSRKYRQDYDYRDRQDENGKFRTELVYIGEYYQRGIDQAAMSRLVHRTQISAAAAAVLLIIAGSVQSAAGRSAFTLIPYALTVLCLFFFCWGAFNLGRCPSLMTRRQYDESYGRTVMSSMLLIPASGLSVLMDLVLLYRQPGSLFMPGDLLFPICLLAVTGVTLAYRRAAKPAWEAAKAAEPQKDEKQQDTNQKA